MKLFMGIDPGVNGGLAILSEDGDMACEKMPETDGDLWEYFGRWKDKRLNTIFALIEQQMPRPTSYFDKASGIWKASILKSTCELWGNFCRIKMALTAAEIPYEECPPKRWQKGLNIQPKEKADTTSKWKNKLKTKAQSLYPGSKIILATSDAILIATYCMRSKV